MRGTLLFVVATLLCLWAQAVRISQKKCEEYAKLVDSVDIAPVLRMGIFSNVVSECAIIETPLIVGGTGTKSKEFPHMVAIGYGSQENIHWDCGGSIISENFVLTAAHCLQSKERGPAKWVRAGTTTLRDPDPDYQERNVVERIQHENYSPPMRYNDIGLLKLDKPLEVNGFVRPACLETENEPPGRGAIATGFGKTSYENDVGSNELLKVHLSYISKEDCKKSYKYDVGTKQLPSGIIPKQLCAGVMEGGKDTCQGDSGGPLQRVLSKPFCTYSIVGVTSFGKFCAFSNSPAVYTRVSSYLDWIESNVWPNDSPV